MLTFVAIIQLYNGQVYGQWTGPCKQFQYKAVLCEKLTIYQHESEGGNRCCKWPVSPESLKDVPYLIIQVQWPVSPELQKDVPYLIIQVQWPVSPESQKDVPYLIVQVQFVLRIQLIINYYNSRNRSKIK